MLVDLDAVKVDHGATTGSGHIAGRSSEYERGSEHSESRSLAFYRRSEHRVS
jgi:hypothetical protein